MDIFDKILKLTKQLFPTGRAFKISQGTTIEKTLFALGKSEGRAVDFVLSTLYRILPDNDNFTDEDATLWEQRLGLKVNTGIDLATRKSLILRKYAYPGDEIYRANWGFIERQLRLAGYDVYVQENRFPDGFGGWEYVNALETENVQHSANVEHSEDTEMGGNNLDLVVNVPIRNEPFDIGDPDNQKGSFFICGETYPDRANVRPDLEIEFRKLILTLKPANTFAILLIDFAAAGNIIGMEGANIIGVGGDNIVTVE